MCVRIDAPGELKEPPEAGDQTAIDEAQAAYDKVSGLRNTMFKGETLRGLLLTVYGFSVFGEKAELASTISFVAAGVLVVLAAAGFIHAVVTPREKMVWDAPRRVAAPQPQAGGS